eukprot:COSAG01_NODE_1067_length_11878_cov_89.529077_3_plen_262_part_00
MHPSIHNIVLSYNIHDMWQRGAGCWWTRLCRGVVATHRTACDLDDDDRALPPSLLQASVQPRIVDIFLPASATFTPASSSASPAQLAACFHPPARHLQPLLYISIFCPAHGVSSACALAYPLRRGLLRSVQAAKSSTTQAIRSPPSSQASSPTSIFVATTTSCSWARCTTTSCLLRSSDRHRHDPHQRRHRWRPLVEHVVTDTLSIGSKAHVERAMAYYPRHPRHPPHPTRATKILQQEQGAGEQGRLSEQHRARIIGTVI